MGVGIVEVGAAAAASERLQDESLTLTLSHSSAALFDAQTSNNVLDTL